MYSEVLERLVKANERDIETILVLKTMMKEK
jgi:hypothetical protein